MNNCSVLFKYIEILINYVKRIIKHFNSIKNINNDYHSLASSNNEYQFNLDDDYSINNTFDYKLNIKDDNININF